MVVMGTVYWSGFPYDNICPADGKEGEYRYCYQEFQHAIMAHDYEDESQSITERTFEAASIIIIIIVAIRMLRQLFMAYVALFGNVYKVSTERDSFRV